MTSTLRARCADAEARAFKAERALKRTRATLRNTRLTLGEALLDLNAARDGGAQLARVLRRLALHQLGEGASQRDVYALTGRWVAEDRKRTPVEVGDALGAAFLRLDNLLGKLFGEDDHG